MDNSAVHINLPDCDIGYYPNFYSPTKADALFNYFLNNTAWQQDDITVFGKTYLQPRLTALYGINSKSYTYSGITMHPHPFDDELLNIKNLIEEKTDVRFTTCLLNLYRHGKDSNGWHSDDETELGKNPVIASVSFGAKRFFHLRHKKDKTLKHKLELGHGSLLIMQGETQHFWQHQIPKTTRKIGQRINLTFRVIQ